MNIQISGTILMWDHERQCGSIRSRVGELFFFNLLDQSEGLKVGSAVTFVRRIKNTVGMAVAEEVKRSAS